MNRHNLQRLIDFIPSISDEKIDMEFFRSNFDFKSVPCKSSGCFIGHSIVLDDPEYIPRDRWGTILFYRWSKSFYDVDGDDWEYLFCTEWKHTNGSQAKVDMTKRILIMIEHGLPLNWSQQMYGEAPISKYN